MPSASDELEVMPLAFCGKELGRMLALRSEELGRMLVLGRKELDMMLAFWGKEPLWMLVLPCSKEMRRMLALGACLPSAANRR